MWVISVVALLLTAVLCALGVFAKAYRDNVLMRVGMAGVCIGSLGRAVSIAAAQWVPPDAMFLHAAILTFACGVAWQFIPFERLKWPPITLKD